MSDPQTKRQYADHERQSARIAALEAENERLRAVVSKVCDALPNGAYCSPRATIDFMEHVPGEVAAVIGRLREGRQRATRPGGRE